LDRQLASARRRPLGLIWFRDGSTATFAYTNVDIRVTRGTSAGSQSLVVTYTGGGSQARTTRYQYVSQYFHPIEFEFDAAAGISGVTSINTGDHPARPSGLPLEALSLGPSTAAGFDVTKSSGDNVVPLAGAAPTRCGATRRCMTRCRCTGRVRTQGAVVGVGVLRRAA
jgi:hypothetical protein